MSQIKDTLRRLFITTCMLTKTTELATRRLGSAFFLPALFVLRYASMGGLDPKLFAAQLKGVRSFKDAVWCEYWNALARQQLAAMKTAWPDYSEPAHAASLDWNALRDALSPLGKQVVTLMTSSDAEVARRLAADMRASPESQRAITALRSLVKAITYYQVSAFPGGSADRMEAYALSRSLFNDLTRVMGPLLGIEIEKRRIEVDGDVVEGYLMTPSGTEHHPLVIITNGLEGTVQELAIPLLRYHDSGMAVFIMEMPGTYAYRQPMSPASEAIYHTVFDQLSRAPRIDAQRMGFLGVSFGAYWAARMAGSSKHLQCAVACGAPTHRTFQTTSTIGIPDIIVRALLNTTGANTLVSLGLKLKALSLRHFYQQIKIPLLVINGDRDTLVSTQDSIDLASGAQKAELKLYPNDDHCAMAHFAEWLDMSQAWMRTHLLPATSKQPQPSAVSDA
ncbi:MAG: alpha/beta hydrolase [Curvibacter sp.]|nr:MAG: alpha/beta hydrolase [Curvibacter sp.]